MKVPQTIEKELQKRGWNFISGEDWRYCQEENWAARYFNYRAKTCLITVQKESKYNVGGLSSYTSYSIQILYAHPICSSYVYSNKQFNVKLS